MAFVWPLVVLLVLLVHRSTLLGILVLLFRVALPLPPATSEAFGGIAVAGRDEEFGGIAVVGWDTLMPEDEGPAMVFLSPLRVSGKAHARCSSTAIVY